MKTKIILFLLFIISIAAEAGPYKITLRGGGRHNMYYEVIVTENTVFCRGAGNNECFGINAGAGSFKGVKYPVNKIVDYVWEQIGSGNNSGNTLYENDIPLRWTSPKSGDVNIEMDVAEITGMKNGK